MSYVKKNYAYQLSYQLLISLLPFVTSPYVSRVLGSGGIGLYTYLFSVFTYFNILAALGISKYGNRAIAKIKTDKNKDLLKQTFTSIFVFHFITSITAMIMYVLYVYFFMKEYQSIAYIQIIYFIGEILNIDWFFQGMEQFKLTVGRNSIIKILTAVLIFLFVKQKSDVWKYITIMATGTFFSQLIMWFYVPEFVSFTKISIKEIKKHFKPMILLSVAILSNTVLSYMDKIMLGSMSSLEQLGYYENAHKMIEFPTGFVVALSVVMQPRITSLIAEGQESAVKNYVKESLRFSLICALAIAFGVAAIAPEFSVIFWGKKFAMSGRIMRLMAVLVVAISWDNVLLSLYLIPREMDRIYVRTIVISAIVNLGINFTLIPRYGAIGAAIGTVCAEFILLATRTSAFVKYMHVSNILRKSIPYALIGLIMFTTVRWMSSFIKFGVLQLIVEVLTGVFVYCSLSLFYAIFFKDKFVMDYIKKVLVMLRWSTLRR